MFFVSIVSIFSGTYFLFSSAQTAYAVRGTEKELVELQQAVAEAERKRFVLTEDVIDSPTHQALVSYTPQSENLRYAQVGGAVYSLLRP